MRLRAISSKISDPQVRYTHIARGHLEEFPYWILCLYLSSIYIVVVKNFKCMARRCLNLKDILTYVTEQC